MVGKKVQDGDVINIIAATDLSGGDIVAFGARGGVVTTDALTGELTGLQIEGVFEFTAVTADTFALGDAVGYNIATDDVTAGAGDVPLGKATTEKAGALAGTVNVKLEG